MHIPLYTRGDSHYVAFVNECTLHREEPTSVSSYQRAFQQQLSFLQHRDFVAALCGERDMQFTHDIHIRTHQARINVYFIVAMQCDNAVAITHALRVYQLLNAHTRDGVWHVVDDIATLLGAVAYPAIVSDSHADGEFLDDLFCAVHEDTISTAQSYAPHITYLPMLHESLPTHDPATHYTVVQGAGISLWVNGVAAESYLWRIGLAPAFRQQLYDAPISTLIAQLAEHPPVGAAYDTGTASSPAYNWAEHRDVFYHWVNNQQDPTLRDVVYRHIYDTSIGLVKTNSYVVNPQTYLDDLVAMHMHQTHHVAGWRDIAITDAFVMVLDNHNHMWAWDNQYQALAVSAQDVIAIATVSGDAHDSSCGFLLNTAGEVWSVTTHHQVQQVSELAPYTITRMIGNGAQILVIDTQGCGYFLPHRDSQIISRMVASPTQFPPLRCIALGKSHLIAIDTTNVFWVWSSNNFVRSENRLPDTLDPATLVALAAGNGCSFGLDVAGHVHAWGDYHSVVSDASLQLINAQGVCTITYQNDEFICQTKRGVWYNNSMLNIPASMDPTSIIKLVRSPHGVWAAIRRQDVLHTLMQWSTQSLAVIPDIDQATVTALQSVGITTLYDLTQSTATQLQRIASLHGHVAQLDQICTQFCQLLDTHGIVHEWPNKAITMATLAPNARFFGWYVASFFKPKDRQSSVRGDNSFTSYSSIPTAIQEIAIAQLEFTTRTHNCLRRADITTVGQLLQLNETELKGIRNLGEKSQDEIRSKIQELAFHVNLKLSGFWAVKLS
jgi:alpha-tubulin suppressor-like RCC1 family protein